MKFKAFINVYWSRQVEIEVNADNIDDVIEGIKLEDYHDKIDRELDKEDFDLSMFHCDDFSIHNIEEVNDE